MINRSKFQVGKHEAQLILCCWRLALSIFKAPSVQNKLSMKTEISLEIQGRRWERNTN